MKSVQNWTGVLTVVNALMEIWQRKSGKGKEGGKREQGEWDGGCGDCPASRKCDEESGESVVGRKMEKGFESIS